MTSTSGVKVDRDRNRQREQERRNRVIQAQKWQQQKEEAPVQMPLFSEPIRIETFGDDDLSQKINKVLGDFDQVKSVLQHPGHAGGLIGVQQCPGTPLHPAPAGVNPFLGPLAKAPGRNPMIGQLQQVNGQHKIKKGDRRTLQEGLFDKFSNPQRDKQADKVSVKEQTKPKTVVKAEKIEEKRKSDGGKHGRSSSKSSLSRSSSQEGAARHRQGSKSRDKDASESKREGHQKGGKHDKNQEHREKSDRVEKAVKNREKHERHDKVEKVDKAKPDKHDKQEKHRGQASQNAVTSKTTLTSATSEAKSADSGGTASCNLSTSKSPVLPTNTNKNHNGSTSHKSTHPASTAVTAGLEVKIKMESQDVESTVKSSPTPPDSFQSPKSKAPKVKRDLPSPSQSKKTALKLPNGMVLNGGFKREQTPENTDDGPKAKLPKLKLPGTESKGDQDDQAEPCVQNILQEMSLHPPLTGIQTPKKDDSARFPFPVTTKETHSAAESQLLSPPGKQDGRPPIKVKGKDMGATEGPSVNRKDWVQDLALSDTDSEGTDEQVTSKPGKIGGMSVAMKSPPKRKMSDSSSSSSGSDSSSSDSDSDSSSSDNEDDKPEPESLPQAPPLASPPRSEPGWALSNFMHAQSADVPGNLRGLQPVVEDVAKDSEESPAKDILNKSNEELLNEINEGFVNDRFCPNISFPQLHSPLDDPVKKEEDVGGGGSVQSVKMKENGLRLTIKKLPESLSKSHNVGKGNSGAAKSPSASSVKSSGSGRSVGKSPSQRSARRSVGEKDRDKASTTGQSKSEEVNNKTVSKHGSRGGNTPSKSKTPPRAEERRHGNSSTPKTSRKSPGGSKLTPKSKEFISSSSDDDDEDDDDDNNSFVDVVGLSSPVKINGEIAKDMPTTPKHNLSSSSSKSSHQRSSSSSSLSSSSKHKDKNNHVRRGRTSDKLDRELKDVFDAVLCPSKDKEFTMPEPLLSPIPNREAPVRTLFSPKIPAITYDNNGKPSLMVHIKLALLDRIPAVLAKPARGSKQPGPLVETMADVPAWCVPAAQQSTTKLDAGRKSGSLSFNSGEKEFTSVNNVQLKVETVMDTDIPMENIPVKVEDENANVADDTSDCVTNSHSNQSQKPAIKMEVTCAVREGKTPPKVAKRKPESDSVVKDDHKRQRTGGKTTPKRALEEVVEKEKTSHEDDHEWDRKHPRRPEERRGSSSSSASSRHSSSRPERDGRKKLKHDKERKREKDNEKSSKDNRERDQRRNTDRDKDKVLNQNKDIGKESKADKDVKQEKVTFKEKPEKEKEIVNKDKDSGKNNDVLKDKEILKDEEVLKDQEGLKDQEILKDQEVVKDQEVLKDREGHKDRDSLKEFSKERDVKEVPKDKLVPKEKETVKNSIKDKDTSNADLEKDSKMAKDRGSPRSKLPDKLINKHKDKVKGDLLVARVSPVGSHVDGHFNGNHRVGMLTNSFGASHIHIQRPPHCRTMEQTEKQESADYYLAEAKKLKHQADGLTDKLAKSLTYVEAIASFIHCGHAMERDSMCEPSKIFTMYKDTLNLLKYICSTGSRRSHPDSECSHKEKKLSVLSLRIQSLLHLKLFKLKKPEAAKLKRVIDDHHKSSGNMPVVAQAPSPYQANWNRSTGTPSPMSPQPSPAGSIGSCGSVGSGNGDLMVPKLTNGNLTTSTCQATVMVPQRIHSVTQQYHAIINYLFQSHDLWDQADMQANENKEFFHELDNQSGTLTLHSSILHLVHYIRLGVNRLKDT